MHLMFFAKASSYVKITEDRTVDRFTSSLGAGRPYFAKATKGIQSAIFIIKGALNGGGGSRTRVRKHSTQASTYLSRILNFVLLVSSRQDTRSTSPLRFRRICHRRAESTILLVDALAGSAGKIRQDAGLFMRPGHIHNRLRLC
jgi:hypothetical protein